MTPDPDLTGPPEYQPDEDPGDDDATLFAGAAYELAGWEFIIEQQEAERRREWDEDFSRRFAYGQAPWGPIPREAEDG